MTPLRDIEALLGSATNSASGFGSVATEQTSNRCSLRIDRIAEKFSDVGKQVQTYGP
jgi:hypothetical protein